MRFQLAALAFVAIPSIALSSTVEIGGTQFALGLVSCTTGDGYYLIDAKGEGVSLSISSDKTYTAIDFFYVSEGEDLRAGITAEPMPLKDGSFEFEGDVPVSNGTTAEMRIRLESCS